MAAPNPPSTGPIGGADFAFQVLVEISLADLAALDASANALLEVGTLAAVDTGFALATKMTLSRKVPVNA